MRKPRLCVYRPNPAVRRAMFTTHQLVWFNALPEGRQTQVIGLLNDGWGAFHALDVVHNRHCLAPDEYPDDS